MLGQANVDADKVTVPEVDRVTGLNIRLTGEQTISGFDIYTQHRGLAVKPDSIGQADFAAFCAAFGAMLQTVEGQAFVSAIESALDKQPLKFENIATRAVEIEEEPI